MNKKIGRFIYYFFGIAAPWTMAFLWDLGGKFICESEYLFDNFMGYWLFGFPIFGFFISKKIEKLQYKFYISKGGSKSLESRSKLSTMYWILSLCLFIFIIFPYFYSR